ncbi:DUF421 domain-containing protein [Paucibacter sp. R3-3]|uniref:DUF421 domain-containing protein n=1 Tax=Roseateles agri TaxID=3098619 RepID=A0ABU5DMP6_9BURK|nr:YetF domain-containing protein [Paucibacter sp. R3-3]MDY0747577.1 DUF421 domain-containing protein [Paucibacter sp. R3-3]
MSADWLIGIHVPPLELVLRGSLMYWFLLLVFRFVLRRDAGSLGVADLLFVVIIADAAQNSMSGSYDTVAEGLILVGTLIFWNYALDWASYHWPLAHKLTEPPPLPLIKAGRIIVRNLRKEFLTREDLEAQLRQAGIDDVLQVRAAFLEGDGKLSVMRYDTAAATKPDDARSH